MSTPTTSAPPASLLPTACAIGRPQRAPYPAVPGHLPLILHQRSGVDPASPPYRAAPAATRNTALSAASPETPDEVEAQVPSLTPERRTAFIEQLYSKNYRFLTSLMLPRVEGDRQLAEDIAQETMVRAWSHAEKLSAEPDLARPWLITVAKNLLVDLHRRRQCRPKEIAYDPCFLSHLPVSRDTSGRVVSALAVQQVLRKLTPQQSDVVRRVYLMDQSMEEVSVELGIPKGTVKSRLFYALRAMGQILDRAEADVDRIP